MLIGGKKGSKNPREDADNVGEGEECAKKKTPNTHTKESRRELIRLLTVVAFWCFLLLIYACFSYPHFLCCMYIMFLMVKGLKQWQ